MPVADAALPPRLLAGGGPSTPDPRVLLALTTPLVGQFDPTFTRVMDEVMQLARAVLLTSNARCYAISALASAGVEALRNTLPDDVELELVSDPSRGAPNGRLRVVDATLSLGGCELRTDEWGLDAVVAGVDCCLGAPSGLTLVTYSERVERLMQTRPEPARTSYLDLLQLQAYWSPERLNHHTAPTSLVYGLREALRLVAEEGLPARWARHGQVGKLLEMGLREMGLEPSGGPLIWRVPVAEVDTVRTCLREDYGVSTGATTDGQLRIGLLGADARPDAARTVLAALGGALGR